MKRHLAEFGFLGCLVLFALLVLKPTPISLSSGKVISESGSQYSFMVSKDNLPSSWNCDKSINVALNINNLPQQDRMIFEKDVVAAFKEIASVSPFEFNLVGHTTAVPSKNWGFDYAKESINAPVVIAVLPEGSSNLSFEEGAAAGGAFLKKNESGRLFSFAGYVIIDLEDFYTYNQGSGKMSHQTLVTHELLHVLGLGHVSDSSSVMTERISLSDGFMGEGDIKGLNALAAHSGCNS
jgi:hypothetical protein